MTYPVVLVEADAGYGKTTLALSLPDRFPRAWYALCPDDRDPLVFLVHVIMALDRLCPGLATRINPMLAAGDRDAQWPDVVDAVAQYLDNELRKASILVLDDYHIVDQPGIDAIVERLVLRLPRLLHLVITSRHRLHIGSLVRWRAAGDLFVIGRADLAFTADEVVEFYSTRFGLRVTRDQAEAMTEDTEGWPIAMQLLGQHLQESGVGVEALVSRLPEGRQEIFAYLSDQVLLRQRDDVRRFLTATACLRTFDVAASAAVTGSTEAKRLLQQVVDFGLFCTPDGAGGHRYHNLFRDFLLSQLPPEARRETHRRAAQHYRSQADLAEAAHHALESHDVEAAADDLERLGPEMVRSGRYLTLLDWSGRLPPAVRGRRPHLLVQRSYALRVTSNYRLALQEARAARQLFDSAMDRAGVFDATAAEALVYLDTVQPARAYDVLLAMGRLAGIDATRRRTWQEMVAENRVNEGRLDLATRAYARLSRDDSAAQPLRIRLLVRRGRLRQAITILESRDDPETRVPRSHRERDAVLAWSYAMLGDAKRAERHARRGISLGQQLRSPIIDCVCTSRLGHAHLTGEQADIDRAEEVLRQALEIASRIELPRFRAESLIGLVIMAGRRGEDADIWGYGFDALEVLQAAGDRYLASLTKLAIGAGAAHVGHPDADRWLAEAAQEADRCGDCYVPLLAMVWRAQLALQRDDQAFVGYASSALEAMRLNGLEAVLIGAPWLGLRSLAQRREWLRAAAASQRSGYVNYLLRRLEGAAFPTKALTRSVGGETTPGLAVGTLGSFRVQRDGVEITDGAWGRRKAQELLWLLCARRTRSITREEAADLLWPRANLKPGAVRFRVALHALNEVLEPERAPRAPTRFVHAMGDRITLDPGVRIDLDEFSRLAQLAMDERDDERAIDLAHAALDLYRGPFLADAPYLDWAAPSRDALAARFVDLALRAARLELSRGRPDAGAVLARRVLVADAYRESAYRLLATACLATGDSAAAQRVFDECYERLRTDLGVTPSWCIENLPAAGRAASR